MSYTISVTLERDHASTVEAVRAALTDQGFGVLTEIDMQATLKAKLDEDIEPLLILGACRPPLASQAIKADISVAALLPCNVVVRAEGDKTVVEALDPQAMLSLSEATALLDVATDARERLEAAVRSLQA